MLKRGGHRDRDRQGRAVAAMLNTMRTPSKSDLVRLGAAAEALYVSCRTAQYDAPSPRDPALTIGLKRIADAIGQMIRRRIEAGHLLEQAEELVHPGSGICCGLRFLAQAEPFLEPADVTRLHALAESQDALDEYRREQAEFRRAVERDMN